MTLLTTILGIVVVGGLFWIILSVARSLIKIVVILLVILVIAFYVGHTLNLIGDFDGEQWEKTWKKEFKEGE